MKTAHMGIVKRRKYEIGFREDTVIISAVDRIKAEVMFNKN